MGRCRIMRCNFSTVNSLGLLSLPTITIFQLSSSSSISHLNISLSLRLIYEEAMVRLHGAVFVRYAPNFFLCRPLAQPDTAAGSLRDTIILNPALIDCPLASSLWKSRNSSPDHVSHCGAPNRQWFLYASRSILRLALETKSTLSNSKPREFPWLDYLWLR